MPNVFQYPMRQAGPAETTHLGFQTPSQVWDDRWKAPTTPTGNMFGGAQSGATGGMNPLISSYQKNQLAENQRSRSANEGRFNSASNYLKQFSTPFSADLIQKMKGQNAAAGLGAAHNAFSQQQGLMDASGQGDASSQAAAMAEANRHAMGATVGANNQLGIDAAKANNAAGMSVGQSILGALPQDRPDDFSGYAQLGLYDQQRQFQNGLTENMMSRPISPGMTAGSRPIGGRYGDGGNSSGAGFNFMNPKYASPPTLGPAGGTFKRGWQP